MLSELLYGLGIDHCITHINNAYVNTDSKQAWFLTGLPEDDDGNDDECCPLPASTVETGSSFGAGILHTMTSRSFRDTWDDVSDVDIHMHRGTTCHIECKKNDNTA